MCACVRVACAHVCMRVCHASVRVPCVCVYVRMHTRVHTTRTHFLWARPRELHAGSPKTDVHAHVARAHAACAHTCAHTRAHAHAHRSRTCLCTRSLTRSHTYTRTYKHCLRIYATSATNQCSHLCVLPSRVCHRQRVKAEVSITSFSFCSNIK